MVRARFDDLVTMEAFEFEDLVEELVAENPLQTRAVLEAAERAARAGRFVAGFVSYDAAPGFDAALTVRPNDAARVTPLAWFGVFHERRAVPVVRAPQSPGAPRWRPRSDASSHASAVATIKERIRSGWTYQVNFTVRLEGDGVDEPFELYRQLATAQRGRYNSYLEHDDWALASSSPECFFTFEDQVVTTRPMKGTAPRGRFVAEDRQLAAALVSSDKERAENLMIVDLIRNDLGKIARYGSVEVAELFSLEPYPTVWQLTSTVTARLPDGRGIADAFAALFPCGSVTGAPKASTMRSIAELEESSRGPYCGAIGMLLPSPSGPTASFSVAIRTAVVDRVTSRAIYGVGGGITWDSEARAEWAEIEAKSAVLGLQMGGFGLFETLRYDAGSGFKNLPRHLARLTESAAYFDIPFDPAVVTAELERLRPTLSSPARVRVALDAWGSVAIQAPPLQADGSQPVRLALDDRPVDSSDRLLFHKTTRRAIYETASARHPGVDDVILQNSAGEVTETTRANLAVLLDGVWYTPDLASGLLPGVERARLIDEGVLKERTIRVDDLERATALATVSSLRGWREAVLVEPARHKGQLHAVPRSQGPSGQRGSAPD